MFKSTFNSLLLIACLWQYVAVVQCSRQSELSGRQRQQLTSCLRECALSFEEDGINKSVANAKLSSRQSCYDGCLARNGKLGSLGNNQSPVVNQRMTLFSKRIKRDALNSQTSPTPSVKTNGCGDCNSKGCEDCLSCPNDTDVQYPKVNVIYKVLKTGGYYANISWVPVSNNTMNHTGYQMDYYTYIGDFDETVDSQKYCKYCRYCKQFGKNDSNYIFKNPPYGLKEWSVFGVLVTTTPYIKKENEPDYQGRVMLSSTQRPDTEQITVKTTIKTTGSDTNDGGVNEGATSSSNTEGATNSPSADYPQTTYIVIAVSIGTLVTVVAALVLLWYFHRSKKPSSSELESFEVMPVNSDPYKGMEFEYDAFIIYSSFDADWVVETLLPALEEKHGFKCCIHFRDFTIGAPFRDNMVESVYKSRKNIAVVSTNFFNSDYCDSELKYALDRLIGRKDDSLLVIKLDDIDRDKLPVELKQRSYIDYPKSIEKQTWEKKLVKCLKAGSLPPHSQSS